MSDQTMKAVRFYAPGDIRVEEIPVPQPGPGGVVIKNKVTLTCGTDVKTYKRGYRYEPPFGFGHEIPVLSPPWARALPTSRLAIAWWLTTLRPAVTATTASVATSPCARA